MSTSIRGRSLARWGFVALAAAMAVALATFGSAGAQETTTFRITIENRSNPEMVVTPGAYLLSTTQGALWSSGTQASLSLERIAEIGNSDEAVSALGAVRDRRSAGLRRHRHLRGHRRSRRLPLDGTDARRNE